MLGKITVSWDVIFDENTSWSWEKEVEQTLELGMFSVHWSTMIDTGSGTTMSGTHEVTNEPKHGEENESLSHDPNLQPIPLQKKIHKRRSKMKFHNYEVRIATRNFLKDMMISKLNFTSRIMSYF